MQMTKTELQKLGYQIVNFPLTKEEILDIRRIYLGLILNYFMMPSLQALHDNYEEPLNGYKFLESFFTSRFFNRYFLFF